MQTVTMLRHSPNATLKEKLKEHYQNRKFTPTQATQTRASLSVTACGIFSLFLECLVILLPGIYVGRNADDNSISARYGWLGEPWWMALLAVLFTWVEVTWNWWRAYYDVPNWVTKEMKTAHFGQTLETPEGWKHCPTCQLDAPPRSHHCQHCGHCILKRDHHCFFTGSCVGFFNQRHFIVFSLYSIWGCLLGIYLQITYLNLSLRLPENYLMYLPPVPLYQLFMGNMSLLIFLILVHVYINLVFLSMAAVFLIWQVFIIVRGQTSYEAWRNIKVYDAGTCKNLTSVFGSPLSALKLVFAPLMYPLKGDGIKWDRLLKSGKNF